MYEKYLDFCNVLEDRKLTSLSRRESLLIFSEVVWEMCHLVEEMGCEGLVFLSFNKEGQKW